MCIKRRVPAYIKHVLCALGLFKYSFSEHMCACIIVCCVHIANAGAGERACLIS